MTAFEEVTKFLGIIRIQILILDRLVRLSDYFSKGCVSIKKTLVRLVRNLLYTTGLLLMLNRYTDWTDGTRFMLYACRRYAFNQITFLTALSRSTAKFGVQVEWRR